MENTPAYDPASDVPAAKEGDHEAQMRIVNSMEGAIREHAADFAKRFPYLSREDLEQEGRIVVLKCIDRWNPKWQHKDNGKRSKFSTYAYPAIYNRMWIISRRTRLLSQLEDRPHMRVAAPKGSGGEEAAESFGLDQLAVEGKTGREAAIEKFRGLGFDRCRVLVCRLGPVIEGREPRSWVDVARMENLSVDRCKEIYEEAVGMVRAAHGEED